MRSDNTFDDKLQRFQEEMSSMPSIVDDVMGRIRQKPIPARHRRWTGRTAMAACALAAACLVGVLIVGWIVVGGRDSVNVALNSGNQQAPGRGEENLAWDTARGGQPDVTQGLDPIGGSVSQTGDAEHNGHLSEIQTGDSGTRQHWLDLVESTRRLRGAIDRTTAGPVKDVGPITGPQSDGVHRAPQVHLDGRPERYREKQLEIKTGDVYFSIYDGCKHILYKNAKWGFIDRTGKVVIAAAYDDVGCFSDGLAAVTVDGKSGYIDRTGKTVIGPQFSYAAGFNEGLAVVAIDGKFGYIDKQGRYRVPPTFDIARDFHEGLAVIEVSGKAGFIDRTGRTVVEPKYDHAGRFSEGLALVKIEPEGKTKRLLAFIDHTGKLAIELGAEFTGASRFSDGLAVVANRNGKAGFIDRDGKLVIPCRYDSVDLFSEHRKGLARVSNHDEGKASFIDKTGIVAIKRRRGINLVTMPDRHNDRGADLLGDQLDLSPTHWFSEGLAAFSVAAKKQPETHGLVVQRWGFVSKTGKVVIKPQFEEVRAFSEGLAAFATNLDWKAFAEAIHAFEQRQK